MVLYYITISDSVQLQHIYVLLVCAWFSINICWRGRQCVSYLPAYSLLCFIFGCCY